MEILINGLTRNKCHFFRYFLMFLLSLILFGDLGEQFFTRFSKTESFLTCNLHSCLFQDLNSQIVNESGGAICFIGPQSTIFVNCSLFYNCTSCKGGAIYFESKIGGSVNIDSSCSADCYVANGEGQFIYAYGDCICSLFSVQKSGSSLFSLCKDTFHIHEDDIKLRYGNFSRNSLFANSAIYGYSRAVSSVDSEISFCRFVENRGIKLISIWQQENFLIKNSLFAANFNDRYGLITNDFAIILIEYSSFIDNHINFSVLFYNNADNCLTKLQHCYLSSFDGATNPIGSHMHNNMVNTSLFSNTIIIHSCPFITKRVNHWYIIIGSVVTLVIVISIGIYCYRIFSKKFAYDIQVDDPSQNHVNQIPPSEPFDSPQMPYQNDSYHNPYLFTTD